MKPLLLPPTIHICLIEEVPQDIDTLKKIEESKSANIVEGFTFQYNKNKDLPFLFYAEINIDNDKLWVLFKELLLQLPDEIACIYHHIDDDPNYGNYDDKFRILNVLDKYNTEISQDGFFEIGVISNTEDFLEEIFIKKVKYLQYWGMDENRFRQTMKQFDLDQTDNLKFIDEYPVTTEWLGKFNNQAVGTKDIIFELKKIFNEKEVK